jgi:hypothetical protein
MTDPLDDADGAARQMVNLYAALGEMSVVIRTGTLNGEPVVIVVCTESGAKDIQPLLEHVLEQYVAPRERTVN